MRLGFGAVASTCAVGMLLVAVELFGSGVSAWQWWAYAGAVYLSLGFLLAEGGRASATDDYGSVAYGLVFLLWPLILAWILTERKKRSDADDDPDAYDSETDGPRDYDDDGRGPGPSVRGGTYRGKPVDRS